MTASVNLGLLMYWFYARPQVELWGPSSAGLESWRLAIAGEIWLKSVNLTSQLKFAFYGFLQVTGLVQLVGVAQKCNKFNE